jgi:hypothetical protein
MNWADLAAPFDPADIKHRKGPNGKQLPYVTNRAIQDRLDSVVGPGNWKNEFREWGIGSPGVLCGLSIRINDGTRDPEWITKWDGAEQTDIEAVKGGLSDAMKRAAVQWGIGRYLYQTETGTAPENGKTSGGNAGQAPTQHSTPVAKPGPYAPTVKQIAFYERLVSSPAFTEDERKRALTWLADKATRQTIKDQIDWLKRQVEVRAPKREAAAQ